MIFKAILSNRTAPEYGHIKGGGIKTAPMRSNATESEFITRAIEDHYKATASPFSPCFYVYHLSGKNQFCKLHEMIAKGRISNYPINVSP